MTTQNMQLAHTAFNVTNSTTEALAADDNRQYVLLENDSDTDIYVAFGVVAALNTGIRLNSGGGSYEMSRENGNMDGRAINAIASVTTKNLLITVG